MVGAVRSRVVVTAVEALAGPDGSDRAPDGRRLEFASIAFSDLSELQRLVREMELGPAHDLTDLPPDAPRYIVSATLTKDGAPLLRQPQGGGRRLRRPSEDN